MGGFQYGVLCAWQLLWLALVSTGWTIFHLVSTYTKQLTIVKELRVAGNMSFIIVCLVHVIHYRVPIYAGILIVHNYAMVYSFSVFLLFGHQCACSVHVCDSVRVCMYAPVYMCICV